MHGDGSDRIVDLELVEHDDREHYDYSGDESHENGQGWRDCISACRDSDETGKEAVERHREVRLLGHGPGGGHRSDCSAYRSKGGSDEDERDEVRLSCKDGTAIEPKPTKEEEEGPDRGERHAVAEDGLDAVLRVFPAARSKDEDAGKGSKATEGVHHCRSGEVVEAGLKVGEEAAAPVPGADPRVGEANKDGGKDQEARKLYPLGHRSGDNRRGGCGEHRLEDEVGPPRVG